MGLEYPDHSLITQLARKVRVDVAARGDNSILSCPELLLCEEEKKAWCVESISNIKNYPPILAAHICNELDRGFLTFYSISNNLHVMPMRLEVESSYFGLAMKTKLILITMVVERLNYISNFSPERVLKTSCRKG